MFIGRTEAEAPIELSHLMGRADSLGKMLMLGKIQGRRRRGPKKTWLDGITDSMDRSLSQVQEMVKDRREPGMRQSMGSQRLQHSLATEQQTTSKVANLEDKKCGQFEYYCVFSENSCKYVDA